MIVLLLLHHSLKFLPFNHKVLRKKHVADSSFLWDINRATTTVSENKTFTGACVVWATHVRAESGSLLVDALWRADSNFSVFDAGLSSRVAVPRSCMERRGVTTLSYASIFMIVERD